MKIKNIISEDIKRPIRKAKASIASRYYGNPSRKLKIIGVTGTSGKSTTSHMIYHVLKEAGLKVGILSTLGSRAGDEILDTGLHVTTPDPFQLQKILNIMAKTGIEYVVLEVSSHALAQGRVHGLEFDYAVYTNIKRDHLDWHGSWENYGTAKASLMNQLSKEGLVIINRDDEDSYVFLSNYAKNLNLKDRLISYSLNELRDISITTEGIHFVMDDVEFLVPIIGSYNVENIMATVNLCQNIANLDLDTISALFANFKGVKGRMEIFQKTPFWAIVDFAHNTDSLRKSMKTAGDLVDKENGKLVVVFGSAGLRDVEKRYTMGETAAEMADVVVVTAEDPRIEKLEDINSQIIEGATKMGGKLIRRFKDHKDYVDNKKEIIEQLKSYKVEKPKQAQVVVFDEESVDSRYDAIDFAIQIASKGDVVITEGKGHEMSLAFGTTEYPFTDQGAMEKALKAK